MVPFPLFSKADELPSVPLPNQQISPAILRSFAGTYRQKKAKRKIYASKKYKPPHCMFRLIE
jgi:hypothetical protein